MNKQGFKGVKDQVVGGAKQAYGNAVGKPGTEASGAAQKAKGKIESGIADLRDKAGV